MIARRGNGEATWRTRCEWLDGEGGYQRPRLARATTLAATSHPLYLLPRRVDDHSGRVHILQTEDGRLVRAADAMRALASCGRTVCSAQLRGQVLLPRQNTCSIVECPTDSPRDGRPGRSGLTRDRAADKMLAGLRRRRTPSRLATGYRRREVPGTSSVASVGGIPVWA